MVKLLIIDKLGSIGELNIKNLLREDLYKKCNYRKAAGFELLNTWKIKHKQEYIIEIHGKRDGKAGLENKYEFPPPVDNELYFGNIALVSVNEEGKLLDITGEEWLTILEHYEIMPMGMNAHINNHVTPMLEAKLKEL
mgnify:CR=1 FL=1